MIRYISTKGGIEPVSFKEAVLSGFAADGGLFVPDELPHFSLADLQEMKGLSYTDLAAKILRKFIDKASINDASLALLLEKSFDGFSSQIIIPITRLGETDMYIQELFHGPTLSFKDIAMGFLVNCMDYFLTQDGEKLSLILATTGDTGPAAAYASMGKKSLECWPLYPKGMISEEQERQMTTLDAANVHPVAVDNCRNGGDDLDVVVAKLFGDKQVKDSLKLSSVNSINWCRVMVQTVHYFHGYFQIAQEVGEKICVSVPTGAFGNLFAGFMAREMGLPVKNFICATNDNGTLHRVFDKGLFSKEDLKQTVSSAIDIVIPYNFWRFLYFNCDCNSETVWALMDEFERTGKIQFDGELFDKFRKGFVSTSVSDSKTLSTMKSTYDKYGYLLDPHGAVAVAAVEDCSKGSGIKTLCLATAHPAKFPEIIEQALGKTVTEAKHQSIEEVKHLFQHYRTCDYTNLEVALITGIQKQL